MNHEDALQAAEEAMYEDIVGIFEGDGIGDPELWEYGRFSRRAVRAYLEARADSDDGVGIRIGMTLPPDYGPELQGLTSVGTLAQALLADFGDTT